MLKKDPYTIYGIEILRSYDSSYKIFLELAEYYSANGYLNIGLTRMRRYEILLEFIREKKLILSILPLNNIEKITSGDSVLEPGLQFVDNICGAIRLNKSNKDEWGFFDVIAKTVHKVLILTKTW